MGSWSRVNVSELPEFPAFAHAAVAGDHVYVAGMLGLNDDFSGMVEGGKWEAMNAAYLEVFGPRTPARIAVGCDALLFGAKVEFDCVAYRP